MKHVNLDRMVTSERDGKKVTEVKLPYGPLPENYNLYCLGDFHVGNSALREHSVAKAIAAIRSVKKSYVVLQGDGMETISVTDGRYDVDVHGSKMSRFGAQRDRFMEMLDPIADRVLWILDGNHERKVHNLFQSNADIAKAWNTVYANGTLVKAIFPKWRMGSWHGAGSINSRSGDSLQRATNQMIALKRNMRGLPVDDCDVVTCGHYHQCVCHPPSDKLLLMSDGIELKHAYSKPGRIPIDEKNGLYRIHEDDKYWMCCGSFLGAYTEDLPSYTEDHGYQATELGYGHIEVKKGVPSTVEVVKII